MDDHTHTHTPQVPNSLGAMIRQARAWAGLSLRNLEAITGVSRPTLNRLEHDQIAHPSPTMLHRVAQALELRSEDLFAFVGYRPSETLPSLAPYLRAKYHLPPDAVAAAHNALRSIVERYDRTRTDTRATDEPTAEAAATETPTEDAKQ